MQSKLDLAALRGRTVPIDEGRARAIRATVGRRVARAEAEERLARVAVPLLAAAAVVFLLVRHRPTPVVATLAPPVAAPTSAPSAAPDFGGVVMADGSRVTFLVAGTELTQSGKDGRRPTLVRGAARFDVVHDASLPFRVTAGSVVVEDVGTVFTIRLEADAVTHVSVEQGAVSVRGSGRETTLEAGDSEDFVALAPTASAPVPARSAPVPHASWKKLAQAGEYDRAYALMQGPGGTVRDDAEELLLAADAARLTGHTDRAVPLLRRLVSQFPSDSRASLAAFTLGRVLLDDLDQPHEAATAFATAYRYGGPLGEDALAREVEAWSRAGDGAAAKDAGARYLVAYPNGRRAAQVRRLTGAL